MDNLLLSGNMDVKSKLIVISSVLVVAYIVLSGVATIAQDANDTVTLDVNVSQLAAIEVLPTDIAWTQVDPGSNGSIYNVSVKNIGSYNLTNFYITVDTADLEASNPVATGDITNYAASGFIRLRNETTTTDYMHLGRLEWNLTEILDTEVLSLSAGVTNFSHGWYRRANGNEYLWKVENGTDGFCNETDASFVIIKAPENASGYSRDLSAGLATGTADAESANWSFFHFTSAEGGPLEKHCVAVHVNCTKIYIYKYDKSTGFGDCVDSDYFAEEVLKPGERIDKLKIKPSIPQGTPAGDAIQSTLTVFTSIS